MKIECSFPKIVKIFLWIYRFILGLIVLGILFFAGNLVIHYFRHYSPYQYTKTFSSNSPLISKITYKHNPSGAAPLSGLLSFTTKRPESVKITILGEKKYRKSPYNGDVQASFAPSRVHTIPVLGLYAGKKNTVLLQVGSRTLTLLLKAPTFSQAEQYYHVHKAKSIGLFYDYTSFGSHSSIRRLKKLFPDWMIYKKVPALHVQILKDNLGAKEKRFFFSSVTAGHPARVYAYDRNGDIRWELFPDLVTRFKNVISDDPGNIYENPQGKLITLSKGTVDRLGQNAKLLSLYLSWYGTSSSHEALSITRHSQKLLAFIHEVRLSSGMETEAIRVTNFQSRRMVQTIDVGKILHFSLTDPYLEAEGLRLQSFSHVNGLVYDKKDDSFIMSLRNSNLIIKTRYNAKTDRDMKWMLARPGYPSHSPQTNSALTSKLLRPVDKNGKPVAVKDFLWPYTQHSPVLLSHTGNIVHLLVFNNGGSRSLLYRQPETRIIEYIINEKAMTVSVGRTFSWKYQGQPIRAFIVGNTQVLSPSLWLSHYSTREINGPALSKMSPTERQNYFIFKKVPFVFGEIGLDYIYNPNTRELLFQDRVKNGLPGNPYKSRELSYRTYLAPLYPIEK